MENMINEETTEFQETTNKPLSFEERLLRLLDMTEYYLGRINENTSHTEIELKYAKNDFSSEMRKLKEEVASLKGNAYPTGNMGEIKELLKQIKDDIHDIKIKIR